MGWSVNVALVPWVDLWLWHWCHGSICDCGIDAMGWSVALVPWVDLWLWHWCHGLIYDCGIDAMCWSVIGAMGWSEIMAFVPWVDLWMWHWCHWLICDCGIGAMGQSVIVALMPWVDLWYFLSKALPTLFGRAKPFVQFKVEGIMRNISVKLSYIWTSGSIIEVF